ncbi:hypothetical protein D3273_27030 [Lichenibacterium minor]|uniref:Uncharacterized protein n=1 Tax=Lichenibacterium minor TaxID=2316528 RepID=A0A4V1RTU4_9HYPH|nr:hypothetical protein [Lichenibacterium minor]RYC28864.1 hypothetical protein D3273_27030 [Lichenibacterium minor]
MDLTPAETALVELLRTMGSEPLHLAFTSTGNGVAFSLVVPDTAPVAGWGPTVEEAMSNTYGVPDPEPPPAPSLRLQVVAGTDRAPQRSLRA